jgi:hypothetical protein
MRTLSRRGDGQIASAASDIEHLHAGLDLKAIDELLSRPD